MALHFDKEDHLPKVNGWAINADTGKEIEVEFVIDTGCNTANLPPDIIADLDVTTFSFKDRETAGGKGLAELFKRIVFKIPAIDRNKNLIYLYSDPEILITEGISGVPALLGNKLLKSMKAILIADFETEKFIIKGKS